MKKRFAIILGILLLFCLAAPSFAEEANDVENEVGNHEYTRKLAQSEFLKSEATCTKKAVYFISCICGCEGIDPDLATFEYGTTAPHAFTVEKASKAAFASAATCTQKARYYKSCVVCDKPGSETFEVGSLVDHKFTNEVATDEYLVSEATCTRSAIYNKSCLCGKEGDVTFEYGQTVEHNWKEHNDKFVCVDCKTVNETEFPDTTMHPYIVLAFFGVVILMAFIVVIAPKFKKKKRW